MLLHEKSIILRRRGRISLRPSISCIWSPGTRNHTMSQEKPCNYVTGRFFLQQPPPPYGRAHCLNCLMVTYKTCLASQPPLTQKGPSDHFNKNCKTPAHNWSSSFPLFLQFHKHPLQISGILLNFHNPFLCETNLMLQSIPCYTKIPVMQFLKE